MWMAGFASRTHASDGKLHDLWAKALALEDADGKQAIMITTDLLGFPKKLSDDIRAQIFSKIQAFESPDHPQQLPYPFRACAGNRAFGHLSIECRRTKEDRRLYPKLADQIVHFGGDALKALQPATLHAQNGVTRFQVNRRNNDAATLERLTEITGPGDAAVPVLKVSDSKGKLLAIAFGYACHPTVLDSYKWSGDYPGFAQIELEKLYPGATALFFKARAQIKILCRDTPYH
jgi:neutral ceramidase